MARQYNAVEVNKFNAGLITDASPLTSPDNSSLDEDNFVLNIDGSRNRRLGLDYEDSFVEVDSTVTFTDSYDMGIRTFRWDNAGGVTDRKVLVVQIANRLDFFHLNGESVSPNKFYSHDMVLNNVNNKFSFTTVDGMLIAVNGNKDIYIFELEFPNTIKVTNKRLLIRDFFGVDDFMSTIDITRGLEVTNRPTAFSNNHIYNLRNQSWGVSRLDGNNEISYDPIKAFFSGSWPWPGANCFPSNADVVTSSLYPDAEDSDNRVIDRFWPQDVFENPIGSSRAPQGYFIIDALDRGTSRLAESNRNQSRYPALGYAVTSLARDESPNGASTVAEFAGRVFYAGFTGEVVQGDGHSPKLSSYVLFSKVVDSLADISVCYQTNDPTSKDFPDILATDGGFIRINEAYGIHRLINLASSLIIVATNGIWRIFGGDDSGFNATNYVVEKITDRGCTSPDSIAILDNGFMYWGDDAIYYVHPDQFGSWISDNITFGRIQRLYDTIRADDRQRAYGEYDSYERKIRWLYKNRMTSEDEVKELILDTQLQAFYTNTVKHVNGPYPKPVAMYLGNSYQIDMSAIQIVAGTEDVVVGGDPVTIEFETRGGFNQRELGYLVVTSISPTIKYTFAKYTNTSFRDWQRYNGVGVDAAAYMITNYISGTDFQRDKQVPYITLHFKRTESGYDTNMVPINQSSCLVQSRWSWSDSSNSGKWGREFQGYRYRRLYLPTGPEDNYDNGFSTIITRNRLRGIGKVLSLRFRTEPYKDCHLYGWSMVIATEENV